MINNQMVTMAGGCKELIQWSSVFLSFTLQTWPVNWHYQMSATYSGAKFWGPSPVLICITRYTKMQSLNYFKMYWTCLTTRYTCQMQDSVFVRYYSTNTAAFKNCLDSGWHQRNWALTVTYWSKWLLLVRFKYWFIKHSTQTHSGT